MVRPIEIMLASAVCLSQVCCGKGAALQGQDNRLPKEQSVSSSPLAQSGNQTNSRTLSGEEHWVKGNFLRDKANYEEAAKEYQLAIDNGYDSNWVRTELGIVLDHYLNRPEEAAGQFRVAIERDEKDWRAHWLLANSLLETKEYDEALKELHIVERLDPKNSSRGFYAYYKAKALDGLGRHDEALKDYQVFLERAKKVEPNSPRVREVRARVEAIKGKSSVNENALQNLSNPKH
jgi:tetratricopeptide (TPR) repeat protein